MMTSENRKLKVPHEVSGATIDLDTLIYIAEPYSNMGADYDKVNLIFQFNSNIVLRFANMDNAKEAHAAIVSAW